jgi:hypothetical protein
VLLLSLELLLLPVGLLLGGELSVVLLLILKRCGMVELLSLGVALRWLHSPCRHLLSWEHHSVVRVILLLLLVVESCLLLGREELGLLMSSILLLGLELLLLHLLLLFHLQQVLLLSCWRPILLM